VLRPVSVLSVRGGPARPWRLLRGNRVRLTLTVIGLAWGVAGICAADLIDRAVLDAFREVIASVSERADLQIDAGNETSFPKSLASAAVVSGVEQIVPVISTAAYFADGSGEVLTVHGFDVMDGPAARLYGMSDRVRVHDVRVLLPGSGLVTRAFANRRGITIGERLELDTPGGRKVVTVRGVLEPEGLARAQADELLVMDLYAAEVAFTRPGYINRLDIVVKPGVDAADVAKDLRAALPAGMHIESPAQRRADFDQILSSFHVFLMGIQIFGLVAGFIIAFSGLSTLFEARTWQLGVLRAVGVRQSAVRRVLIREGLLLGMVGVAVGLPFGIARAYLSLPLIAQATAIQVNQLVPPAEMVVRAPSVVLAALVGLGTALLAATIPAWRAARMGIAVTLRARGVEQPDARPGWWAVARVLTVIAIAAAIAMQTMMRSAVWGLVATAFIALATALAARPLVTMSARWLAPGLRRLLGPTGGLAVVSLVRNPRRAALTVAVIGVGVGSMLWLRVVANSFERSLRESLTDALRADVVASSAHMASAYLPAPIDAGVAAELATVPGVDAVAAERQIDWEYGGAPITIIAADPARVLDTRFGRWPLLGSHWPDAWEAFAEGRAVIVATSLALGHGLQVGDRVTLTTPHGPLELPVAAVSTYTASARGTIFMSRDVYARRWDDTQITFAFLMATPNADLGSVRSAISQNLGPRYGLRTISGKELVDFFTGQVGRAFAALYVLAGIVLVVVLIGLGDTLAAGVLERTREFGMLRSIGIRRRDVRRIVMLEGLVLGALGLVLAIASGLALGALWTEATFPYLLGWVLTLHIPYSPIVITALLVLIVALLASLAPALRAAALQPATALRLE
jgi:putative ABC transport system permease protein